MVNENFKFHTLQFYQFIANITREGIQFIEFMIELENENQQNRLDRVWIEMSN